MAETTSPPNIEQEAKQRPANPLAPALLGALLGLLAGAPLLAVQYVIEQLFGTVFAPFIFLDWQARALPGGLITTGIDAMVDTLILLGFSVSETAKTVEQLMAVAMLLVVYALFGAGLFALRRGVQKAPAESGLIAGLLLGILFMLMLRSLSPVTAAPAFMNYVVIVVGSLALGLLLDIAYNTLFPAPKARPAAEKMSVEQVDRRRFLIKAGVGSAAITVVGAGVGSVLSSRVTEAQAGRPAVGPAPAGGWGSIFEGRDISELPPQEAVGNAAGQGSSIAPEISTIVGTMALPNADAELEPAPGTRPEYTPLEDHYQIDINARPPLVLEADWTLEISGLVDRPVNLSLADLVENYEQQDHFITLSCISNRLGGDLIGTTRWTGCRLSDVLADAGVQPGGRYLRMFAADGFDETLDLALLEEDERIMLVYAWDGKPLEQKHGFPLRIWIPDRYGMKQPKWITRLEVTDTYEDGYWVRRNWSRDAIVWTTSVIDTVAVEDAYEAEGETLVPLGGIAYAGARSISQVEVRVDGGDWQQAELREPIAETTWVIWRYDWPFEAGSHTFEVRCVDGEGDPQIETEADVRPDGATGIDGVSVNL